MSRISKPSLLTLMDIHEQEMPGLSPKPAISVRTVKQPTRLELITTAWHCTTAGKKYLAFQITAAGKELPDKKKRADDGITVTCLIDQHVAHFVCY